MVIIILTTVPLFFGTVSSVEWTGFKCSQVPCSKHMEVQLRVFLTSVRIICYAPAALPQGKAPSNLVPGGCTGKCIAPAGNRTMITQSPSPWPIPSGDSPD
jgi:hypothetical protein